jgi:hypothetical protein
VRPLYDARVGDLGPRVIIKIRCDACSHSSRMVATFLLRRGLQPYEPILSLRRRLRCRRCHSQGHVDISIEWREP